MQFLQKYVQEQLGWRPSQVKQAYISLQKDYRVGQRVGYANEAQIQAYVFTRFPATYNVCLKLFEKHLAGIKITSVLDWGCGIGTASLALSQLFSKLEYYLVEQDSQAKIYATQFLKHFFPENLLQTVPPKTVDLSVFSYSLGEVNVWQTVLDEVWPKTQYLLIIEPGTSMHFKRLLQMRDYMLTKGAHIWGPCCHSKACPLTEKDWCHFAVNVARSKEHRLLKNAERGFEQEAYSYLLFAKEPADTSFGRLVSAPRLHGGHMALKICSENGEIITPIVGRSDTNYKHLKKRQWGDSIDENDFNY
jgi:ribosomal protein RSM22 (predicted rRNA methylase)